MGTGLMGGTGFLGLVGKDLKGLSASGEEVGDYKKCCGFPRVIMGTR